MIASARPPVSDASGAHDAAATITLALISHTNTGKTTLARTLLAADVGEVADAAHVTVEPSTYAMIDTPEGDALRLVDTPGFADSARLARRLAQQANPIGWLLAQVWDRFRDRPLWLAQQAVRSVRDAADVVLYLVNASEDPADAGYVAPELDVLTWIGKPVVVLLNQTGPPRPAPIEAAEADRWRRAVAREPLVHAVLGLDAFARCWVQEVTLLDALRPLVSGTKGAAFERASAAWLARRLGQFDASIDALCAPIAMAACDKEPIPERSLGDGLRNVGQAIGIGGAKGGAEERAMRELAARADRELRAGTDRLIEINGLEGRAAGEMLARLAQSVTADRRLSEGKAAMVGGFLSGALSGLAADLASGGLTLGAGMLAGGVLGALGGAGIARGYNVARGTTEPVVRWSEAFLEAFAKGALLRYLAVAHFGRGRGEWAETEAPAFWVDAVARAFDAHRDAFHRAWRERASASAEVLVRELRPALHGCAAALLVDLYPAARAVFGAQPSPG